MKTITVQVLGTTIESVLKERESLAKVQGQKFNGIDSKDLIEEIDKRIGSTEWALKKDEPIKFTPQDLNAVANSRFMRTTGTKILMGLAIVVLGLASMAQFRVIPVFAYFGLCGLAALGFFYYFAKKQTEAKKSFWKGLDREQ